MSAETDGNRMNELMDLWVNGRGTRFLPAPWEGDWRLAIAEERVAMAQAKLAAAERRVRELEGSLNS